MIGQYQRLQRKRKRFSKVEFLTYEEGLCVQCMHIGPIDNEPATIQLMHEYMRKEGYELDITEKRFHHEIYLSDARKVAPERLKTVIRHPIKRYEFRIRLIKYGWGGGYVSQQPKPDSYWLPPHTRTIVTPPSFFLTIIILNRKLDLLLEQILFLHLLFRYLIYL